MKIRQASVHSVEAHQTFSCEPVDTETFSPNSGNFRTALAKRITHNRKHSRCNEQPLQCEDFSQQLQMMHRYSEQISSILNF